MYIRGAGLLPVYIQQGRQELSYHRKAIYTPLCIDSAHGGSREMIFFSFEHETVVLWSREAGDTFSIADLNNKQHLVYIVALVTSFLGKNAQWILP